MDNSPIIGSFGSYYTQFGFSGDCAPRSCIPSLVGPTLNKNKHSNDFLLTLKDNYIGDEAWSHYDLIDPEFVFKKGIIQNYDHLEKLIHHIAYNEIRVGPDQHPWLFSEHMLSPRKQRETLAQIMFESFGIPAFQIGNDEIFSLYASGRTSGTVLSCGHGVTSCVSIYEGCMVRQSAQRGEISGQDVIKEFENGLLESKNHISFKLRLPTLLAMMIKNAHVWPRKINMQISIEDDTLDRTYELPDGSTVTLNSEYVMPTEIMFNPSPYGYDEINSVQNLLKESIQSASYEFQPDLFKNIILEGRASMFANFPERLTYELGTAIDLTHKIKVVAPPERAYSVWIGQSILSSLTSFDQWITKEMYDEIGPESIKYDVQTPLM